MSTKLKVLIFLCCLMVMADAGRYCQSCNGLNDGEFCPRMEKCNNDEVCFTQTYLSNNNEAKVDVGCAYPELCIKGHTGQICGRKRDHSHILCHQCCNDTDICNAHLTCEDKPTVSKQICMSCERIDHPFNCNVTTTCLENEICYMHKFTTNDQTFYDLGCKHFSLCTHGFASGLGRRRSSQGTHQICESCCFGTQSCNRELQCDHYYSKPLNGLCTSNTDCSQNFICKHGFCVCQNENYFLNGQTCIERKGEHSKCLYNYECKESMVCKNNSCSCDDGSYWSGVICSKGKTIYNLCTSPTECKNSLYCIHGQCLCATEIDFWNGTQCLSKYSECEDINSTEDGVYTIFPGNGENRKHVYCLMRSGKKWTVIQRRENGSVDFYRTWQEYKEGFGSAYGEYWIGNEYIHLLSNRGQHEITMYMEIKNGSHRTANYSTFSVASESSKYQLTIAGYSGDAGGDSMDNVDPYGRANGVHGAWWYNNCCLSDFNRRFGQSYWAFWSGSITKTFLAIRRI